MQSFYLSTAKIASCKGKCYYPIVAPNTRLEQLTPEERKAFAKAGSDARWKKYRETPKSELTSIADIVEELDALETRLGKLRRALVRHVPAE